MLMMKTPDSKDIESAFEFNPADPTPMIGAPQAFAGEKGRGDENDALLSRPRTRPQGLGKGLPVLGLYGVADFTSD